ncbi:MAG: trigger factor [Planctomycetota bacterium]|nr:trigger factor [Planctomycetota bacterium]
MEATFETIDTCEVVVTVSVPADEFNAELNSNFARLAQNVKMKGFRPGKVPKSVIEKHHGEQLRSETQQHFVNQGLQQAVSEGELRPVGQPRLAQDDLEVAEGGGFTCKVGLSLRPTYELGEYKGLTIEAPKVEVTDDEVDEAITGLREGQARPEPAGDGGCAEDGMALGKIELLSGENVLMAREGMRLSPQTVPPGLHEEPYKAAMIGSKDGDVLDVPMTFPDDFQPEELRGTEGLCRITVAQVFDMQRPTDEDLMKLLKVDDMDAMKERVREDIQRHKENQRNQQIELNLLEKLIEMHDIEIPARLLADQIANRKMSAQQQMAGQGASEEEIAAELEQNESNFETEAIHNTKALFLLEDLAQAEGIQVQNEDVARKFQEIAQRNQTSVEEVQKYYSENNLINQLAMEILEIKVRAFLRENAEITEG